MYDVFYKTNTGASIGKSFKDDNTLKDYLKTLKKKARIFKDGVFVGEVYKQDKKWMWYFWNNTETKVA